MDPLLDARLRQGATQRAQTVGGKGGAFDAPEQRGAVACVEEREGHHVLAARLATEQLGVALDAVDERGGEPGVHLQADGANVLGEDRRGGTVGRPDVAKDGVVTAAFRVVVDHHVDRSHAGGRVLSEHRRLYVDEGEAVELVELLGLHRADLDAQRLDHCPVLGPIHRAEGDEGRGRSLPAEKHPQCVPAGDAVRIRVGLQQDANPLAWLEECAELHDAPEIAQMRKLLVDVVADQRAEPRAQQAVVGGKVSRAYAIGEQEDGRVRHRFQDHRNRRAGERQVVRHQRELVAGLWVELQDAVGGEAALERVETRRPSPRRVLAGNPGEDLLFRGADVAPEPGEICSIAENDAACHPTPSLPDRLSRITLPGHRRTVRLGAGVVGPWTDLDLGEAV